MFELLQNCDDNDYSKATRRKEDPYVSFQVFKDRLVIQTNEDGFEPKHVRAICEAGQSSKSGAHGYIGEKGIGFKSVFIAAHKVWIQSGDYSFMFQHEKEDGHGMGMISPIWTPHDESVPSNLTQFTLFLHGDDDPGPDDRRLREDILQQLTSLHDSILLFLKKLKRIEVHIYDDKKELESSVVHTISWRSRTDVVVARLVNHKGKIRTKTCRYHVVRHVARNLSQHGNRTYSKSEQKDGAHAKAEVVLAFPLDPHSNPLLENQWVFAFLPLRQMGFKVC